MSYRGNTIKSDHIFQLICMWADGTPVITREISVVEREFRDAIDNNDIKTIKRLLVENKIDPSYAHNSAIATASYLGYIEIMKLLMTDSRVDPSDYDNCAIRWASWQGRIEAVRLLLKDSRVDPTAKDNRAVKEAYRLGFTDIVSLLMSDKRVTDTIDKEHEQVQNDKKVALGNHVMEVYTVGNYGELY